MNKKTLNKLEYNKIIEMLTDHASSFNGRELCRKLKPMVSLSDINAAQQQTAAPPALRQGGQEPGEATVPWEEPGGSPPGTGASTEDADKEAILQTLDAFRKQ